MLTIKAPQNAGQKPCICNPRFKGPERPAVIINIIALTTRVNKPRVRTIKGKVKIIISGFKSEFMIPKIAPMIIIFHHSPENVIPSITFIATAIDRALIITRKIKYPMFYNNRKSLIVKKSRNTYAQVFISKVVLLARISLETASKPI